MQLEKIKLGFLGALDFLSTCKIIHILQVERKSRAKNNQLIS
jgi:hypothetical protein